MIIYVMRHGQTNYNQLHLCNDDPSRDVHLTPEGIAQAQAAAEKLRDARLEHILTSQLPRTQQTAQIVNQYHKARITPHGDINDIRSGFDGKPVADYFAAIAHDRINAAPPGGESLKAHKQRVHEFFDWLVTNPWESVLVVAHEETLRAANAYFLGQTDDEMLDQHFDNCQIIEFDSEVRERADIGNSR